MHDFDQFERRLADALRSDADASVGPFEAGSIARAAIAASQSGATRVRQSSPHARRFGRGRGITLLAAAALLLLGGALAAIVNDSDGFPSLPLMTSRTEYAVPLLASDPPSIKKVTLLIGDWLIFSALVPFAER